MDPIHATIIGIQAVTLICVFLLVLHDIPHGAELTKKELKKLALGSDGLSLMERRGREFARSAVKYAEQLGGTSEQKLAHALGAFRVMDMRDGKRDYPDAQARVLIEAVLGDEP